MELTVHCVSIIIYRSILIKYQAFGTLFMSPSYNHLVDTIQGMLDRKKDRNTYPLMSECKFNASDRSQSKVRLRLLFSFTLLFPMPFSLRKSFILQLTISAHIIYFLTAEDLALLHDEYDINYHELMRSSAQAALKVCLMLLHLVTQLTYRPLAAVKKLEMFKHCLNMKQYEQGC